MALLLPAAQGRAQQAGMQQAASANLANNNTDTLVSTDAHPASSQGTLSAAQIDAILQDKPEIVVELKQLAADQLQQQGLKIQPDSITDEVLFRQIAASATLRASITTYLRARGYVADTDMQHAQTLATENEEPDPVSSARDLRLLAQQTGSEFAPVLPDPSALTRATPVDATRATSLAQEAGQRSKRDAPETKSTRDVDSHNTTDAPTVLHRPAPYNLLAMRDLYTQLPEESTHLKRFGSEVFTRRNSTVDAHIQPATIEAPLDIPIGPDYVVGPGDSLSIDLWGGVSQTLTRIIDREGRISLPEAGSLQIAGLALERAQSLIGATLKQQYRNAQVAVTVSRLRTVRVYVVGDVQRPGAYDLSSLSTPLNALIAAGGPTAVGSLRVLRHLRGTQLIAEIDLYSFLLHGIRIGDDRFQGGDTLLVPPAGPQVAISGAVKRPAIYELMQPSGLADVLEDAGGATVAAALGNITVERIDAHQQRETTTLPLTSDTGAQASLQAFQVRDGDRIHLSPILPFSERVIYLEGHVTRPGRQAYTDGMRLKDVLRSYKDLLPEPAAQGEIVRLIAPDLHAESIQFDVAEALIGNVDIALQPFDTIRILGRYEVDAPRVTVRGEVLRPGVFPLSEGMTAAQLVRMAGGFRRGALQQNADLTSYHIVDGNKVIGQHTSIAIGDAVANARSADIPLKPGDILTIHQLSGWNDIGASVTIAGEANHPGSYGFQEGERLSSVLRRAGGLRNTAYPAGAVLIREQVRELEEKSRAELIHQIESSSAAARLSPNLSSSDSTGSLQILQQQQEQVLARLRSQPASGRLVIHITSDIDTWANTDADIEMRRGDVLTIPKRPGFVLVSGQVYNASAITFVPGKTAGWYLQHAGGASDLANRKEIFVIRANGSVVGRRSGTWHDGNVLSTKLDAGDVVVVPQKIIGASQLWRNLLTVAQIASSVAITAFVAGL